MILYISRSNSVSEMHVKNGSKDLKRYPQISRRVRDTLARLIPLDGCGAAPPVDGRLSANVSGLTALFNRIDSEERDIIIVGENTAAESWAPHSLGQKTYAEWVLGRTNWSTFYKFAAKRRW